MDGDQRTKKLLSDVMSIYLTDEEIETEQEYKEHQATIKQIESFCKTTLFRAKNNQHTVLQPTLFDRVYCIPVDPDDFALDVKKTNSTKSGRRAFRIARRRKSIVRRNGRWYLKPRRKSEGKVSIYEYFVAVEMITSSKSESRRGSEEKAVAEDRSSPRRNVFTKFMSGDE